MMNKWLCVAAILLVAASLDVEAKSRHKKKEPKGKKGGASFEFSASGPLFSIPVMVGSQGTRLRVGIEGYYGASVVYGTGVACDGKDKYCIDHDTFDRSKSTTFKQHNPGRDFKLTLGTAHGPSGSDSLSVGSLALKDTMFGVADSIPSHLNRRTNSSGFLSMNAPETQDSEKTTLQKIVEQGASPTITFYAPDDEKALHTVTIGKEDTKNCKSKWSSFKNVKSPDPDHKPWTIEWRGFKWGTYTRAGKISVALNPGADYFVAPKAEANYIYAQLGAAYDNYYEGGMVGCSNIETAPNLEFTMEGGKKFVVEPKQYIKKWDEYNCLLNIYPFDDVDLWVLPYQAHHNHCIKFDYGKKTVEIAEQKS